MDAPLHFYDALASIDQIPLDRCVGPALLINLSPADDGQITEGDLAPYIDKMKQSPKLVLNTGWASRWGDPAFFTEHPVITEAAAQLIVECGIHLIGVDFPSVDQAPYEAHLVFLGNDILIVENLTNLNAITTDIFHLVALPLRIAEREASPVRAVAIL